MRGYCQLCHTVAEVRKSVVRWKEAEPGKAWEAVTRCVERIPCRARVEDDGRVWLVDDGTPSSKAPAAPEVPAPASPKEELPEWL